MGIISILQHVYFISIEKEKMEIFLPFWIFFKISNSILL